MSRKNPHFQVAHHLLKCKDTQAVPGIYRAVDDSKMLSVSCIELESFEFH